MKPQVFMSVARAIAKLSDLEPQVGAIIEGYNNITASGYNHYRSGQLYHAEIEALANCDNPTKARMYVTTSPCLACAKAIIEASLGTVYYEHEWWDKAALVLLQEADIETIQIKRIKKDV